MLVPLTNNHIHVFDSECAPKNFLRIIDVDFVRKHSAKIKWLLDNKRSRSLISKTESVIKKKEPEKRKKFAKYISFLNIATQKSQLIIFRDALKVATTYDPQAHLLAMTLDMDFMDDHNPPDKNYCTQLIEVKQIKRYYPDNFFPFISIDPRARSGETLLRWVRNFFEFGLQSKSSGKTYPFFSGIKMYPALGFFPFDPRLDKIYDYAEKNGIPITLHCTRVGSLYIGKNIEGLIPLKPKMIMPKEGEKTFSKAKVAQNEIYERIKRYTEKGWIKNSKIGKNDLACDLFSHPQNYVPIMLKFPKLKICLAHMGGEYEIEFMNSADRKNGKPRDHRKEIWDLDGYNWAELIRDLMKEYSSLYTDISFSVSDLDNPKIANNFNEWLDAIGENGKELGNRILFGTDYYMTEMVNRESELYKLANEKLEKWFDRITRDNSKEFLY